MTHLCILCLKSVNGKAEKNKHSWKSALCTPSNATNALGHLKKMHKDSSEVKDLLKEKKTAFDSNSKSSVSSAASTGTMKSLFAGWSTENQRLSIFKWIVYANQPFNSISSPYFKNMFTGFLPTYKSMARDTFMSYLDREFDMLVTMVKNMFDRGLASVHGRRFLCVCHDMWTTLTSDNALGSSIRFITEEFRLVHVSTLLIKNNVSHAAEFNADTLQSQYIDRYGIDLAKHGLYITSDTTNSARAVSKYIDGMEQVDCEMHKVNLALLYTLGLRENVKVMRIHNSDGTVTKEKTVVTPGGSFEDGSRVIKQLRGLCKYFGTGQRKQALHDVQSRYTVPVGIPAMDGITRVASCSKLLQTSILHKFAMSKLYTQLDDLNDDFSKLWEAMSDEDWQLVVELEALTVFLSNYALGEAQMDSVTASAVIFFRKVCQDYANLNSYKLLEMVRPHANTTLKSMERVDTSLSEFSTLARTARRRLICQVEKRFGDASAGDYLPIFLDPVTCPYSKSLCPEEVHKNAFAVFKTKHREIFEAMNDSGNPEEEETKEAHHEDEIDDPFNIDMDDDIEEDEEYGKNHAADEVIEDWIRHCRKIDWRQYGKDGANPIDSKKSSLFGKICCCDILRWFRESGGNSFPSIALLARIELAKMDNSGFQERVFSSASGAMSENQAKMSFDVLAEM